MLNRWVPSDKTTAMSSSPSGNAFLGALPESFLGNESSRYALFVPFVGSRENTNRTLTEFNKGNEGLVLRPPFVAFVTFCSRKDYSVFILGGL